MYLQEAKITSITKLCKKLLSEKSIILWEADFKISSNAPFFTLPFIKNLRDNKVKQKSLIATQNKTGCKLDKRTEIMVQQSDFEQSYKNPKCGNFDSFVCRKIRRIGGTVPEISNRLSMEQGGEPAANKNH